MSIRKYLINKAHTGPTRREVRASEIIDGPDFVDFCDGDGIVLRMRKEDVATVERVDENQ
jgi:hypothetical protein